MNKADLVEDLSFLLYLVPIILSGGYAITHWLIRGLTATLPTEVYLAVTKDPYIFLIGLVSVFIGALLEVFSSPREIRHIKLDEHSKRMQVLSIVCFATAAIFAWYAAGYTSNLTGALTTFLDGKYSIIFPAMLMLVSFFISPIRQVRLNWGPSFNEAVSIALIVVTPLLVYSLWRLNSASWQTFGLPLITLIAGFLLGCYTVTKRP